jgi:ketosteroid isomerase-like protein
MSTKSVADEFFRRLDERNPQKIADMFVEDDLHFFIPGPAILPFNGARQTRADVEQFYYALWSNLVDSIVETDEVIIQGAHMIAFGKFTHTAQPTGRRFSHEYALHIIVQGKQIKSLQVYDDTYAVAQAFAPAV